MLHVLRKACLSFLRVTTRILNILRSMRCVMRFISNSFPSMHDMYDSRKLCIYFDCTLIIDTCKSYLFSCYIWLRYLIYLDIWYLIVILISDITPTLSILIYANLYTIICHNLVSFLYSLLVGFNPKNSLTLVVEIEKSTLLSVDYPYFKHVEFQW